MYKGRFHIEWLDSVDSTNNEAKRRIDSLPSLAVISAREQTSGRGQGDHAWLSMPGKNLTFSIVVKYRDGLLSGVTPANQIVITEIISLTILDLLSAYGVSAQIKWPNDIYVGDKKICGILIEHAVRGSSLLHSIIGVGLNVNQKVFDESLPNPTSILLETCGVAETDLSLLLDELLELFLKNAQLNHSDLHRLYSSYTV